MLSKPIVVEGDLKALFSLATISRYRGGLYSFPRIAPLTLDPYLIMMSVKREGIKYHFFEFLVWLDLRLNTGLPDHRWTLNLLYFLSNTSSDNSSKFINCYTMK